MTVGKPTRTKLQKSLFGDEAECESHKWQNYWRDMPEWKHGAYSPARSVTLNFLNDEDYLLFVKSTGIHAGKLKKSSIWYPHRPRLTPGKFVWEGVPSKTRYPVFVPSKGRPKTETTGRLLTQAGCDFYFVVEPSEASSYEQKYPGKVLVLPFENLGLGSIPARNWIWEYAKKINAAKHWILDDNIRRFSRSHDGRRLAVVRSSAPLRAVEDFSDRYDNIAISGLMHEGFVNQSVNSLPIAWNTRVYSCTLIDTSIPYEWRGRYNEDTDLCLRVLKDGRSIAAFRALCMNKAPTSRGDGRSGMSGGNTSTVYAVNDRRRSFAESLRDQHPDVVNVEWKFGRWHHVVDYLPFKNNDPRLRPGAEAPPTINEYGLKLVRAVDAASEASK